VLWCLPSGGFRPGLTLVIGRLRASGLILLSMTKPNNHTPLTRTSQDINKLLETARTMFSERYYQEYALELDERLCKFLGHVSRELQDRSEVKLYQETELGTLHHEG
jgi:hypothetical protein